MARGAIALIEASDWIRTELEALLAPGGLEVVSVPESALDVRTLSPMRIFILGNSLENPSHAIGVVRRLHQAHPRTPVFLLAWVSSEPLAIAALKEGVADYFPPPVDLAEVAAAVDRTVAGELKPAAQNRRMETFETGGRAIIGQSRLMHELRSYVQRVARRDCNVLVLGETGTGKDLVAEAIHLNSPRQSKPFVSVNCAAIPDTLLESELFGYEKGAFTGANCATEGKIRQAHNGTIFFDEIGEMTAYAQAKILKVIEGKQIQRLGGKAAVPVNVRIIAATNQDLPQLVAEQRFRKDLFFRLNVAQVQLPSLRERREDIQGLLEYYVAVFNRHTGSAVEGFTREALDRMVEYDWPGNVRELRNIVESIFVDPPHAHIDVCHLPRTGSDFPQGASGPNERDQLLEALHATRWNKSKAAEKLNWSRMKIYRKMAKYEIEDGEADPESVGAAKRVR